MATQEPALRRIIFLLYAIVALSVLIAILTFVFSTSIIDYRLTMVLDGRHVTPAAVDRVRASLTGSLWLQPVLWLAVSVFYAMTAARLTPGNRRQYQRLIGIGLAGVIVIAYAVLSVQLPPWMRIIEAVRAVALLSMLVVVTLPSTRALFPKHVGTERADGYRQRIFD